MNPFSPVQEPEKYIFFKQMTEAINEWMLKQYPEFDNQLTHKIGELRKMQQHIRNIVDDQRKETESIKEKHANYITGVVETFLKKTYPDLDNRLVQVTLDLESAMKKHAENIDKFEEKLKTVIKSDTVYEDIYKLRDEFKEIKTFMEGFKKKVKKAFEI